MIPHPSVSRPPLILFLLILTVPLPTDASDMDNSTHHSNESTFLYFAYGSNLLKERLQLKNPSASVYCVAKLKV